MSVGVVLMVCVVRRVKEFFSPGGSFQNEPVSDFKFREVKTLFLGILVIIEKKICSLLLGDGVAPTLHQGCGYGSGCFGFIRPLFFSRV